VYRVEFGIVEKMYTSQICDVLLDVRYLTEWNAGHLEHAIHVPIDELGSSRVLRDYVKDCRICVYCRSGNRAMKAAALLSAANFTSVYGAGGTLDAPGVKLYTSPPREIPRSCEAARYKWWRW
jgi:rhodanese-related sulfurtransferase